MGALKIGDRVRWGDKTWTIWSAHKRRGYWWLVNGDQNLVEAKATSIELVEQAPAKVGLERKAEGQAQVLSSETQAEWRARFEAEVRRLADGHQLFTSEDVVDLVGMPSSAHGMNRNNAVGAMMTGLARKGIIRKTDRREPSRRPSSHGAEIVVWTGVEDGY